MQRRRWIGVALLAAIGAGGCDDMKKNWDSMFASKEEEEPAPDVPPPSDSKSVQDTVQSMANLDGMRVLVVRGYGLVVGLLGTGGTDCPDDIRKYLQQEILKHRSGIPTKELLDSRDTAAVEVTAEIPAAAQVGERFDVVVRAMGNQAVSLDGGTLLMTELKVLAGTPRGIIEGKTVGAADGPVFISPFRKGDAESNDLRVGRVLGGGVAREARRVRLTLSTPAYSVAVRIRDRLNARYGAAGQVADAVSPEIVQLTIPSDYKGRERLFLNLVLRTTLNGAPAFVERRAKEIAEEMQHPSAPYDDLALTWEAMGRTIVPVIKPLYANPTVAVSYYSARAGLRLGDTTAIPVMIRHATQANDPFRLLAIEEMGNSNRPALVGDSLVKLAGDEDNKIRIAAYTALRQLRNSAVSPSLIGQNFVLDVVDCGGSPLVHVATSEEPRIAVFGRGVRLRPPANFHDDGVTIASDAGDTKFRVVRVNQRTKVSSPILSCGLGLPEFIRFLGDRPGEDLDGKATGLGIGYSSIVRIVYDLNKQGSLPATVIIERPSALDDLQKIKQITRPESEL